MKIYIWQDYNSNSLNLSFIEERNGKRYIARPMDLVFTEIEESHVTEPTMKLGYPISKVFLEAMAEALDENKIETDKDAKIKGTLEATKYHLEDLRELLKLSHE